DTSHLDKLRRGSDIVLIEQVSNVYAQTMARRQRDRRSGRGLRSRHSEGVRVQDILVPVVYHIVNRVPHVNRYGTQKVKIIVERILEYIRDVSDLGTICDTVGCESTSNL